MNCRQPTLDSLHLTVYTQPFTVSNLQCTVYPEQSTVNTLNCTVLLKLDGVGPIDNRHSTNKFHHCFKRQKNTHDMWHVTRHMWHMTRGMWHVTCFEAWTFSPNFYLPKSHCLWFMIFWRFGGKGSLTESISNRGDCKAAPATPDLLIHVVWKSLRLKIVPCLPHSAVKLSSLNRVHSLQCIFYPEQSKTHTLQCLP